MSTFVDQSVPKDCDSRQEYFLKRAAAVATRSSMNHRHGCVIVNKAGEVVSEGYNNTFVHMYHKYSTHAEVACLSKMKRNKKILSECEMYIVRIGTDGMGNPLKYSKPCPDCTKAILKSGIRKVFYSTSDEFYYKLEKIAFTKA